MIFKKLDLDGFKSFVYESINFGQLTLLTGLNSSGKSTIIQSLLMLQKGNENQYPFLEGHGNMKELTNPYKENFELVLEYMNEKKMSLYTTGNLHFFTLDIGLSTPNIIYISADRFGPETSVPIFNEGVKLGKRGENLFNCIRLYEDVQINELVKHEKAEGDTFLFNLKAWLGVISPNVKFTYEIQDKSDSSFGLFNNHRAKNVGFGLSYTLPVITALLLGTITPNSVVIIENPEAHLHPRGQTELARLISLCAEAGTQIIIETHSDHIFDGIRTHAKESKNNFNNLVKIYWFELDKNNNTNVQEAVLDSNGRIKDWPIGLFDQFEINARKLF